ncbi:unnamed protein product [Symbiodinium pilosum]|uniref:Uncharacterized protein n=1 Tax=Symbiodinium pilosum TaxID=2952 RepID=A0A812WZG1_SYMPI|nr:unnamed protein product [Symbiodinium pilosum]
MRTVCAEAELEFYHNHQAYADSYGSRQGCPDRKAVVQALVVSGMLAQGILSGRDQAELPSHSIQGAAISMQHEPMHSSESREDADRMWNGFWRQSCLWVCGFGKLREIQACGNLQGPGSEKAKGFLSGFCCCNKGINGQATSRSALSVATKLGALLEEAGLVDLLKAS